MARVTQLRVQAPHLPGTLAQICTELAKVAVNINGIMAAPEQPEGIRLLATPLATARKTLDQLGFAYKEEEAIAVRVNDRPGALGRVTRKLADAGINVTYAYGSIVKGEARALIVIGVSDIAKADKLV
ncbi:MAG: ACT domain-containing protein [Acidobacteriota bacterium]|nr:ACT domain-containing protein [Acidobacteriota bacterium]